jgi:hypothetical protein
MPILNARLDPAEINSSDPAARCDAEGRSTLPKSRAPGTQNFF